MLIFRSEEAVAAWCRAERKPLRPRVRLDQLWRMATAWYADRLKAEGRRPRQDEIPDIFAEIGLTGDFWNPSFGLGSDPDDPVNIGLPWTAVPELFSDDDRHLFAGLLHALTDAYGSRLLAVKLVGSRARGTPRPDSDYDFLIFLDRCDYQIEVPRLARIAADQEQAHAPAGPLSLSPMTRSQFLGLDHKFPGITGHFRNDALHLWMDGDAWIDDAYGDARTAGNGRVAGLKAESEMDLCARGGLGG